MAFNQQENPSLHYLRLIFNKGSFKPIYLHENRHKFVSLHTFLFKRGKLGRRFQKKCGQITIRKLRNLHDVAGKNIWTTFLINAV